MQALEELDYLAALDDDGNLSEIGIIMSEIPLEPQMAKALLASCEFDCVSEMLTIAAMLSSASCVTSSLFYNDIKLFFFVSKEALIDLLLHQMDIVMESQAELEVLSDTKPEGLCKECLCCTDADFFFFFF